MKTKLGLAVCLTFISLYSFGQVEFGVRGGFNINNVKITNMPSSFVEYKSSIAIHIGVFTQYDFSEKLHLNSDLLYIMRGYKGTSLNYVLTYLEIPILLSYSLLDKLEIELGPTIGIKLFDNPSYESTDFGPTVGLRYNLTDKVLLSSRYYHGLTPIGGLESIDAATEESKSFNRVVQFTFGYKLK